MKPYHQTADVDLYQGDCRAVMAGLPERHFQLCCTSPPFFGLRSYLPADHPDKHLELGSETSPDEFVAALLEVFGGKDNPVGVWRVLRDDGCLFCDLGDSYNSAASGQNGQTGTLDGGKPCGGQGTTAGRRKLVAGLKPKDLCGTPWRLALALQAAGWYWRDTICYQKASPMPGSQRDRCTSSWEPVLMLTKSSRYFFDSFAIRERSKERVQFPVHVIQPPNLDTEPCVLSNDFRLEKLSAERPLPPACVSHYRHCVQICIGLAAPFLNASELKANFGLPFLDAEVRKQLLECPNCQPVTSLPAIRNFLCQRPVGLEALVITAKGLMEKTDGFCSSLRDTDDLAKSRILAAFHTRQTRANRDRASGVQDTSQVRQNQFLHRDSPLNDVTAISNDVIIQENVPLSTRMMRNVWRLDWDADDIVALLNYMNVGPGDGNIWKLSSEGFAGCHFATFPKSLPAKIITAATSERGACPSCGKCWQRVVDSERVATRPGLNTKCNAKTWDKNSIGTIPGRLDANVIGNRDPQRHTTTTTTLGWRPGCTCGDEPVPCRILDPFGGVGTSALAAMGLQRRCTLIELSEKYCEMIVARLRAGLYATSAKRDDAPGQLTMFSEA